MRRRTRGNLAVTLMLISCAFLAVTTLTAAVFCNFQFSGASQHTLSAQCEADSAIAIAIERIIYSQTFGTHQETLTCPAGPAQTCVLTFDAATATAKGLPCSVNNVLSGTALGKVGPYCASLAARAVDSGYACTRQAMVFLPPYYPYVMASSGPIDNSAGGLEVASLQNSTTSPPPSLATTPTSQLQPGNMGSLSNAAQAIILGPNSLITGNVESQGGVNVLPPGLNVPGGTQVDGEVQPNSEPPGLPNIALIDPTSGIPGVTTLGSSLSGTTLSGANTSPGSLTVTSGDLDLDDAVLYVNGDLNISQGGITGIGALFVTGNVNVATAAQVSATNQQVLMCGGDVKLNGVSQQASAFQGLVYTAGSFTAKNITLYGTFLDNSTTPGAKMTLANVSAGLAPQYQSLSFTMTQTVVVNTAPPPAPPNQPPPAPTIQVGPTNTAYGNLPMLLTAGVGYNNQGPMNAPLANGATATTYTVTSFTPPPTQPGAGQGSDNQWGDWVNLTQNSSITLQGPNGQTFTGNLQDASHWLMQQAGYTFQTPTGPPSMQGSFTNGAEPAISAMCSLELLAPSFANSSVNSTTTSSSSSSSSSSTPQTTTVTIQIPFSIDLNQFVAPADRLRLLLWKTI